LATSIWPVCIVRGGTPGSVGVALPQCMQNCASSGSVFWQEGHVRAMLDIPAWWRVQAAETT
jgi:hypothetical protein